jgi:protein-S-isoprenylcysteine O-methyltransferase Ste14
MDSTTIAIIVALVALFLFLFVARRMFRLALKLFVVGIIVLALLAGGVLGWWQGWFNPAAKTERSTPVRRTPSR